MSIYFEMIGFKFTLLFAAVGCRFYGTIEVNAEYKGSQWSGTTASFAAVILGETTQHCWRGHCKSQHKLCKQVIELSVAIFVSFLFSTWLEPIGQIC